MSTDKQRRAAARRKLERQLERRQEMERQRKQQTIILTLVATVVVIGLVTWFAVASSQDDKPTTEALGCQFTADGSNAPAGIPSEDDLATSGTVDLQMSTNRGDIQIQLDRAGAPCAVESFVHLTEAEFFNDTICHRLTTGSFGVLQCGDPTGAGSGGPGYRFLEEEPTGDDPYPAGIVAMANTGQPGSTGSQFFICYTSCSVLPPSYSVVGEVTEGLDIVEEIGAAGTSSGGSDGAPKDEVHINSIAVVS